MAHEPAGPQPGRGIALYERGAGGGNANAGIDLEKTAR